MRNMSDIVIACFFSSLAIMTKGMFTLIPIICALGGEFIVKRQWKNILNPIWLFAIVIILVLITPELYALYYQFDVHPEKIIFDKTNVSGIKFFFWDSQFGRFFNTAPIKGSGDIFFFMHTILWAFLPWALLFYIAIFLKIKRNLKKVRKHEEFYTLFASLGTILVFSLSKFQLPHYTNIVFPFMAILTAHFIFKLKDTYQKLQKTYYGIQYVLITIGLLLIPTLWFTMQPAFNWVFLFMLFLVGFGMYQIRKTTISKVYKVFYYTTFSFLLVYGFMMTHFYPTLLKYQGGVYAAKYANEHYNKKINFIDNKTHNFGFEFYINSPVNRISEENLKNTSGKLFYLNDNEVKNLKEKTLISLSKKNSITIVLQS